MGEAHSRFLFLFFKIVKSVIATARLNYSKIFNETRCYASFNSHEVFSVGLGSAKSAKVNFALRNVINETLGGEGALSGKP